MIRLRRHDNEIAKLAPPAESALERSVTILATSVRLEWYLITVPWCILAWEPRSVFAKVEWLIRDRPIRASEICQQPSLRTDSSVTVPVLPVPLAQLPRVRRCRLPGRCQQSGRFEAVALVLYSFDALTHAFSRGHSCERDGAMLSVLLWKHPIAEARKNSRRSARVSKPRNVSGNE